MVIVCLAIVFAPSMVDGHQENFNPIHEKNLLTEQPIKRILIKLIN